jgi:hypothetical protein
MNMTQTAEALAVLLVADVPAMLWGPPGIGKTDLVEQVARDQGRSCITETLATMEPVDLRGLPWRDAETDSVAWSKPDFLVRLEQAGPEPVLFVDEANANNAGLQVCLMQLVLNRRVGPHRLPEGTRIVLAGNRVTDRAAAQRMPTALANRLSHLDVEPDVKSWLGWAARVQLHPVVVAFISWRGQGTSNRPGLLHQFDPAKPDQRAFPSPRSWAQVAKLVDAPDSCRAALIASQVGDGPAAELEGFIRLRRELPPLPSILANPTGAPVPSQPSLQYLVTVALSRAANAANFTAVLTYVARLGREFEIVAATDAVRRDPTLAETAAFVHWAAANADVMI